MSEENNDENIEDSMEASMEETLSKIKQENDDVVEDEPIAEGEAPAVSEDETDTGSDTDTGEDTGSETDTEEEFAEEGFTEEGTQKDEVSDPPPSTWRPAAKDKWKDADPVIKEEALKRENDMMKGLAQHAEKSKAYDEVASVVQPYEALIRSKGVSSTQVIQSMLNTYYQLETATPENKKQLIGQLAQNYGVDLGLETGNNENQAYTALEQRFQSLQQKIDQQQYDAQNRAQDTAASEIQAFATAVDENGQLKYPYFENLREEMTIRIKSASRELSLEEAYNDASWSNPETRALMQTKQSAEEEAKRQEAIKAKVAQAKKADKVNLGNKGSHEHKQSKPTGSVEDTLKETLATIKERSN